MPAFEEEKECPPEFTDYWIFQYADMVTLLLVFFILLFSFCKVDVEKFKSVAESFKPAPPGTPFFLEGKESVLEAVAAAVETTELSEEVFVTIDERGVVVSFKDSALFESGSARIRPGGRKTLERFGAFLYAMSNDVVIEGHTDDKPTSKSLRKEFIVDNLELSVRRATGTYREMVRHRPELREFKNAENPAQPVLSVSGYGEERPIAKNDTEAGREQNRRIDLRFIMMTPQSLKEIENFKNRLLSRTRERGIGP